MGELLERSPQVLKNSKILVCPLFTHTAGTGYPSLHKAGMLKPVRKWSGTSVTLMPISRLRTTFTLLSKVHPNK